MNTKVTDAEVDLFPIFDPLYHYRLMILSYFPCFLTDSMSMECTINITTQFARKLKGQHGLRPLFQNM